MAIFTTKSTATTPPAAPAPTGPTLAECEAVIAAGLDTVSKVGAALHTIKTRELYRASHVTFISYLADRWKMTGDYANKLIEAAVVCDELTKLGLAAPTREAHARELRKVPSNKRAELWTEVLTAADGDPAAVTAELIAKKAAPLRKAKARRKTPKTIVLKGKGWTVSIARKSADLDPLTILAEVSAKLQAGERKAA